MSVVLEAVRAAKVRHFVYASSSSVYGGNTRLPFSEDDRVDRPVSFYAATKRANEAMAYSYAHLYRIPSTGLRFFTVYGPWGRPDMAAWLFTDAILSGRPIRVFEKGRLRRDFTYIDDIVEGVIRVLDRPAAPDPTCDAKRPHPGRSSTAPYRVYNIGNDHPVELLRYIEVMEDCIGRRVEKQLLPMQPGDVPDTHADVDDLRADTGYAPDTPLETGIARFIDWYRGYYKV